MANYYVSSSYAGGTSNGQLATPWKSLTDVSNNANLLVPGTIVSFKTGDTFTGSLNLSRSGTASNRIVFNSYGAGAKPKFTGTGSTIAALFYLNNTHYNTFDNLEILDPTIDIDPSTNPDRIIKSKIERAFEMDGSSHDNIISNCKITAVGVGVYWVGPSNTMTRCYVADLTMVVDDQGGVNDYGANPVVLASSNNIITENTFLRCWAHSYDFAVDGGAVEFYGDNIQNNYIARNFMMDCNGILEQTGANSSGNKFHYNIMVNNGQGLYFHNTVTGYEFHNNIYIETAQPRCTTCGCCVIAGSIAANGISVKNNFFSMANTIIKVYSGYNNMVRQNNVYKVASLSAISLGYTLSNNEKQTTANQLTDLTNNNPVLWNFAPLPGSLLINTGQNLGLLVDYSGAAVSNPPDIGALEEAAPTTTTSTTTTTTAAPTTTTTTSTTTTSTTTTTTAAPTTTSTTTTTTLAPGQTTTTTLPPPTTTSTTTTTTSTTTTTTRSPNTQPNRYWIKLNSNMKPISGSLVMSKKEPVTGTWYEVFNTTTQQYIDWKVALSAYSCYKGNLKYFYKVDNLGVPVSGANTVFYTVPTSGNYVQIYPPVLDKCSLVTLVTTGTPRTTDRVVVDIVGAGDITITDMGAFSPFRPTALSAVRSLYFQEVIKKVKATNPSVTTAYVKDGRVYTVRNGIYINSITILEHI